MRKKVSKMQTPKNVPAATNKSLASQELGNLAGRRGAGMTTITSGNPLMHMMNHYGKDAPPLITDMVGPPQGMGGFRR